MGCVLSYLRLENIDRECSSNNLALRFRLHVVFYVEDVVLLFETFPILHKFKRQAAFAR